MNNIFQRYYVCNFPIHNMGKMAIMYILQMTGCQLVKFRNSELDHNAVTKTVTGYDSINGGISVIQF